MGPFGSFVERQKRIFGTISKGEDPRKKFYQGRRSSSWRWEEKEAARSDPWTRQRRSDPAVAVARPRTSGSWKLGDLLVAETESEVEAPFELIQVLIRQALRPRDAAGSLLSAVRPVHVSLERHPAALPRPYLLLLLLLLRFHRQRQRNSVGLLQLNPTWVSRWVCCLRVHQWERDAWLSAHATACGGAAPLFGAHPRSVHTQVFK
ncbi:unnamed protein product [Musa banksii]